MDHARIKAPCGDQYDELMLKHHARFTTMFVDDGLCVGTGTMEYACRLWEVQGETWDRETTSLRAEQILS